MRHLCLIMNFETQTYTDMTQPADSYTGLSRLKLFLALSRTPHGLLDMATPALGALLWLGRFPSFGVIILGLVTTFAGYTVVYALNDVVDYRVDKEKIRLCGDFGTECDLDAVMIRHPMAQGYLSFKEGVLWTAAWSMVAILGAYYLNPVCIAIFIIGCALETVYCLLLKSAGALKRRGRLPAYLPWIRILHLCSCRCCFSGCSHGRLGARTFPMTGPTSKKTGVFMSKPFRFAWVLTGPMPLFLGLYLLR